MTSQILFLVGMPRSGTKLLRDMLNRHPTVAIFPIESHFFPVFSNRFASYGDIKVRRQFSKLYADLQQTIFFNEMNTRGISIAESDWFDKLQGNEFRDVLKALFHCYAEMTGCHIVGDKTPAYMTQAPLLLANFPDAKFIHIVRDPRDYVISMRKAWNQNLARAAQRWKQSIRKFHADLHDQNVEYFEVKYEELLSDPSQCLKAACKYLDISFNEDMLVLEKAAENLGDAKGVLEIVQNNFGKWKTQLSSKEIRTVESIAGALMHELGYDISYCSGDDDVGSFRMGIARVQDAWNRFRFILRDERSLFAALAKINRMVRYRLPGG